MMNEYTAQRLKELESHGRSTGEKFYAEHKLLKDRYFVECGATLVKTQLFNNTNSQDGYYRDGYFPASYARDIMRMRVSTDIEFAYTLKLIPQGIQRFYEESYLEFKLEKMEAFKIYLFELMAQDFILNPSITAAYQPVQSRDKFASWYTLLAPLKVAKDSNLTVNFIPAQELVAIAYSATETPDHPNSALAGGAAGSDRGFVIRFYMDCVEYMVAPN